IVAVGGAVGAGASSGLGAALGYNEIHNTTRAALDNATVTVDGFVTVEAKEHAEIGTAAVGVEVGTGNAGFAAARAASINLIVNTIDAHISNGSEVTAGEAVTVKATDAALLASVGGGVGISVSGSTGIGAAVSYNRISDGVEAYIDSSTVQSINGSVA